MFNEKQLVEGFWHCGNGRRQSVHDPTFTARDPAVCSIAGNGFGRMMAEELPYFKLHTVDLCEKTTGRGAIVFRVWLRLPQLGDLILETPDPFQSDVQLLIVRNHGDLAMI